MEEVFEDSACWTLEHVRGSKCFSETAPTVWIEGDSWPPYEEVVTRYPLCGASKLNVFVDCVEGQSTLTFGLISSHERRLQMLGIQNEEQHRLTGKLWAWNSKLRKIFNKPFDSRTSYGSSSQITHLYDSEIKTGSVLCVYRNLKTNRIHFVINGTEGTVSFSSGALDFCYGYVRLCSWSSDSKIQVTLMPERYEVYFNPSPPIVKSAHVVEPVTAKPCCVVRVGQATHQDNSEPIRLELAREPVNKNPWWLNLAAIGKSLHTGFSRSLPDKKEKQIHQEPELKQHPSLETKGLREKCTQLEQENMELHSQLKESESYRLEAKELQEELVKLQTKCNKQEQENVELHNRLRDATKLDRYERGEGPRGICLVINNVNFLDEDERRGSEIDEKEITVLFSEELHFIVEVRRNLGGREISKAAEEIAKKDHSKYTAFAFFIMSHGDEKDVIQGVDGRRARVEDLMIEFTATNCPTLENKPKLFFIQACRGQGTDPRMNRLSASPDLSIEGDTIAIMQSSDSALARGVSPREADFLLAFATVPGSKSWRSTKSGSWFVQVLVDVIRRYHPHHHLIDMLTVVNKEVSDIANEYPHADLSFQVPAPTYTLRKQVYL